jgi:hypothetical protein
MVRLRVRLRVDLVESVLWLSGARTVQEAVELALLNLVLNHLPPEAGRTGGARSFWLRARLRDAARGGRP